MCRAFSFTPVVLSHLQNYQHCYQADGEPLVRKHSPYEILNSTGVSAIRWYSHNGIYVMVATVIAKEYRCG